MERRLPMSRRSHDVPSPLTAAQLQPWITSTSRKRFELHLLATEPWQSPERQAACLQMSELLQNAIKEVRMLSTSLQENSQKLRDHATGLRERSTARVARGTHALERMASWTSPPPAEV